MGVGILGAVRFGLYENFKNSLASSKGIAAFDLSIADRSLCAFATGFLNSFLMVKDILFSLQFNIQELEFRSKNQPLKKSILDHLMLLLK